MYQKSALDLNDAQTIAKAALQEAHAQGWAITIVVSDDGGHPLLLERMDKCPAASSYIATEKARTAALGRKESAVYENMINGGRTAFLSAPVLQGLLEGAVPVLRDGQVIGAVGVSGAKSDQDVQVARAGIAALGLA
jgi:glc operon protein GlcG